MNGHEIPGAHAVLELRRRQPGNGKVLQRLRNRVADQVQQLVGKSIALARAFVTNVARPRPHGADRDTSSGIAVGHAVDQGVVPEGERKLVTALFVDIINSTGLGQDLDPEEARAIIDPALVLMIDAVRRYDGHVVQSTGDGIFALFGAPVAHEDHPQRSLYAALRLQDEIRRMSDRLRTEGRTPIEIRAGVNTGEVVVRSIKTGDRQTEYTPIGHTVNLASRMQSVANAGAIVISDNTRNLVEGYFALRSLGPTRVKGINDSVRVYEVAGLGPLRTRLERSAGRGLSKFVGRAQEKQAFRNAARLARSGSGQLIAVAAEPGVGKSRLFFEFKAEVRRKLDRAGGVLGLARQGVVLSAGDRVAARLFRDRERRRACQPAGEGRQAARPISIHRSRLRSPISTRSSRSRTTRCASPPWIRSSGGRARSTLWFASLLTEAAREPLMLIVEDLHWLDDESQALLDLLVEQMADARLLLLVNFRPEYQLRWGDKSYAQSLRLDALGHDNADEMLSAMLGESDSLLPLKQLIIETTGGTPFFMEETVQALFDEGALEAIGGVGRADQAACVVAHSADRANHPRRAYRPAAQRREDAPANSCRPRPAIRPQPRQGRRRTLGRGTRASPRQSPAWRVRLRAAVDLRCRIYLQARAHAGGRLQLDPPGAPQATA